MQGGIRIEGPSLFYEKHAWYHIAGKDDYLLKIRSKNIKDLDHLISHEIKSMPANARTQTAIVMGLFKVSSALRLQTHDFPLE
ncbi:Lrp/AsnC ligand binding domain-containing protein [Rossellomorea aquimaris]|uniref:Lrp/AsnC ligand binding domain-containing protein n=1 Tax=Rossellomorea aquimaris TaxID=189382 RepID=UPI0011E8AFF6|nr:Lrp/AsnC ligand binding domain-containing protein [Rossellomorea aquimaris]TYS89606.1 Lrp/AsnC family transcriptional regulator [Rossellomorea aquimaris]